MGFLGLGLYVFMRCPVSRCHCPQLSDGRDLTSVTCVMIFPLTDLLSYLNTPGKEVPLEPTSSKVLWLDYISYSQQRDRTLREMGKATYESIKVLIHPQMHPHDGSSYCSLIWQIRKLIPKGRWGQLCICTNFITKSQGPGSHQWRSQVRAWLTYTSVFSSVKWGCSEKLHHTGVLRLSVALDVASIASLPKSGPRPAPWPSWTPPASLLPASCLSWLVSKWNLFLTSAEALWSSASLGKLGH